MDKIIKYILGVLFVVLSLSVFGYFLSGFNCPYEPTIKINGIEIDDYQYEIHYKDVIKAFNSKELLLENNIRCGLNEFVVDYEFSDFEIVKENKGIGILLKR